MLRLHSTGIKNEMQSSTRKRSFWNFLLPTIATFFSSSFISFCFVEKKWFENESNFSFFSFLYKWTYRELAIWKYTSSIRNLMKKKKVLYGSSLYTQPTRLFRCCYDTQAQHTASQQWCVCESNLKSFSCILQMILFFFLTSRYTSRCCKLFCFLITANQSEPFFTVDMFCAVFRVY